MFLSVLAVVFCGWRVVGADGDRLAKFRVMSENRWIIRAGEDCGGNGVDGCVALVWRAVNLAVL